MTNNIIFTDKVNLASIDNQSLLIDAATRDPRKRSLKDSFYKPCVNQFSEKIATLKNPGFNEYMLDPDRYCDCCGRELQAYIEQNLCKKCDKRELSHLRQSIPNPKIETYKSNVGFTSLDSYVTERYEKFKNFFLSHSDNKDLSHDDKLTKMYELPFDDYKRYQEELKNTPQEDVKFMSVNDFILPL